MLRYCLSYMSVYNYSNIRIREKCPKKEKHSAQIKTVATNQFQFPHDFLVTLFSFTFFVIHHLFIIKNDILVQVISDISNRQFKFIPIKYLQCANF